MSEWISVKHRVPPTRENNERMSFVLAFHLIHGVGVAWFWKFKNGDGIKEKLEEDFKDKYICSCQFILNRPDRNYCIDDEEDIDIFEHSPHFPNLGTVTHWMPLPESPEVSFCEWGSKGIFKRLSSIIPGSEDSGLTFHIPPVPGLDFMKLRYDYEERIQKEATKEFLEEIMSDKPGEKDG